MRLVSRDVAGAAVLFRAVVCISRAETDSRLKHLKSPAAVSRRSVSAPCAMHDASAEGHTDWTALLYWWINRKE